MRCVMQESELIYAGSIKRMEKFSRTDDEWRAIGCIKAVESSHRSPHESISRIVLNSAGTNKSPAGRRLVAQVSIFFSCAEMPILSYRMQPNRWITLRDPQDAIAKSAETRDALIMQISRIMQKAVSARVRLRWLWVVRVLARINVEINVIDLLNALARNGFGEWAAARISHFATQLTPFRIA